MKDLILTGGTGGPEEKFSNAAFSPSHPLTFETSLLLGLRASHPSSPMLFYYYISEGSGSFCQLTRYVNNPLRKCMNSTLKVRKERTVKNIISKHYAKTGKYAQFGAWGGSCSFITIPNGLRQHAIPEGIILFALAKGLIEKLPEPSINYILEKKGFRKSVNIAE